MSYTLSDESSSAPAFDFSDPPPPLDTPQDPTPSPEINPGSVMNSSSSSPIPSALAPSEPRQQEGVTNGQDTPNPFEGLFDLPKTELAPGIAPAQGPSSSFQVCINSVCVCLPWLIEDLIPQGCPSALQLRHVTCLLANEIQLES